MSFGGSLESWIFTWHIPNDLLLIWCEIPKALKTHLAHHRQKTDQRMANDMVRNRIFGAYSQRQPHSRASVRVGCLSNAAFSKGSGVPWCWSTIPIMVRSLLPIWKQCQGFS